MNSYDLKTFTDHLAAITDHVEAISNSGAGEALVDVYYVLDTISDELSNIDSHAETANEMLGGIAEQLTQISNTLARTMGREPARFITLTDPENGERVIVSVRSIVAVFSEETGATLAVSDGTSGTMYRTQETPDEILTMINAGAYVPPF